MPYFEGERTPNLPDAKTVHRIGAQVFDAPVVVPAPGEYVAAGAAVQAAWLLTASGRSGRSSCWPNLHPMIALGSTIHYVYRSVGGHM